MTLAQVFKNIADAIRAKKGSSAAIKPVDMANEITNLPSGGGESELNGKRLFKIKDEEGNVYYFCLIEFFLPIITTDMYVLEDSNNYNVAESYNYTDYGASIVFIFEQLQKAYAIIDKTYNKLVMYGENYSYNRNIDLNNLFLIPLCLKLNGEQLYLSTDYLSDIISSIKYDISIESISFDGTSSLAMYKDTNYENAEIGWEDIGIFKNKYYMYDTYSNRPLQYYDTFDERYVELRELKVVYIDTFKFSIAYNPHGSSLKDITTCIYELKNYQTRRGYTGYGFVYTDPHSHKIQAQVFYTEREYDPYDAYSGDNRKIPLDSGYILNWSDFVRDEVYISTTIIDVIDDGAGGYILDDSMWD